MRRVRVLIAEDDRLLREALLVRVNGEDDLAVVGVAADGGEAVRLAGEYCPDVLLIGDQLLKRNGLHTLVRFSEQHPDCRVLVLGGAGCDETSLRAVLCGARGSVLKPEAPEQVTQAIRSVAVGEAWLPPQLAGRVLDELARLAPSEPRQEPSPTALTAREREILCHIGAGETNGQIAKSLFISPHTVKIHVSHILHKLKLPNRTEAAVFAVRHRIAAGARECPQEAAPTGDAPVGLCAALGSG